MAVQDASAQHSAPSSPAVAPSVTNPAGSGDQCSFILDRRGRVCGSGVAAETLFGERSGRLMLTVSDFRRNLASASWETFVLNLRMRGATP